MSLTAVPVTPRAAPVNAIATGGTAVTAFEGPCNGFMLLNTAGAGMFWSLTGAAATSAGISDGVLTFALASGATFTWDTPLAAGVSLSCNAVAAQGYSCMVW